MLIEEIKKRGKVHAVRLQDMKNFFKNPSDDNREIYRVFSIQREQLVYDLTIIKPGNVNKEFFMTRGHYHKIPSSEVYYCIKGEGILLMQKGSDFKKVRMRAGKFYEVREGYAHRTVNIRNSPLQFITISLTKSGHDYKTIEKKGFKQRIMSR